MSNIYNTTKEIHTEVKRLCEKYGKEFELKSHYYWYKGTPMNPNNFSPNYVEYECLYFTRGLEFIDSNDIKFARLFLAIQEPQIKQILVAFSEVLGENPEYRKGQVYNELYNNKSSLILRQKELYALEKESQAEALYQKWWCGFPKSQFETDPESVLAELLTILKTI